MTLFGPFAPILKKVFVAAPLVPAGSDAPNVVHVVAILGFGTLPAQEPTARFTVTLAGEVKLHCACAQPFADITKNNMLSKQFKYF